MPRRKLSRTDRMLRVMVKANWTMEELMASSRMTLEEVAAWVAGEYVRGLLQALRFLEDYRVQMAVSRHRITAATRLIRMVHDDTFVEKDREILRRACAELLRMKIVAEPTAGEMALAVTMADDRVSDAELLAALRGLAADPDDRDAGAGLMLPAEAGRTGEGDDLFIDGGECDEQDDEGGRDEAAGDGSAA